jgi:hypothetical protein
LACSFETCNEVDVCLVNLTVPAEHCVALAGERFVFVLFGPDTFVLQKVTVCACELLHDRRLLVVCLQDAILVRSELLELRLEKLVFLAGCGFLVQDEDVADVVGVDLDMVSGVPKYDKGNLTFSFRSLSTCCLSLFTSCSFLSSSSTLSI